jgi:parallel beta-helix repeat protein
MKTINRRDCLTSLTLITFAGLILFGNLHPAQSASAGVAPNASHGVIRASTTIQAAVDVAQPGDTIVIPPGLYRENVRVTKDHITIRGSRGAVMDGAGLSGNSGIRVAPVAPASRINGFVLFGLTIQNYSKNGVLLSRVDNFQISHGSYVDNDEYGIFPILSSHGLIDFNHVSGSNDTGIYVGQSSEVVVEKNHTRDCTIGIDIENSSHILVRENTAVENSVGMTIHILPSLEVTVTSDVQVIRNTWISNNRPNPATDPDDLISRLPSGLGFLNLGGDDVTVKKNIAIYNKSAGIAVSQLPPDVAALDARINPFPDNNHIVDNLVLQNGDDPDPKLSPFPGRDLLWDFSGTGNCWAGNVFKTSFPMLPACP